MATAPPNLDVSVLTGPPAPEDSTATPQGTVVPTPPEPKPQVPPELQGWDKLTSKQGEPTPPGWQNLVSGKLDFSGIPSHLNVTAHVAGVKKAIDAGVGHLREFRSKVAQKLNDLIVEHVPNWATLPPETQQDVREVVSQGLGVYSLGLLQAGPPTVPEDLKHPLESVLPGEPGGAGATWLLPLAATATAAGTALAAVEKAEQPKR